MALVNPVTTGKGMNLMAPPTRARPRPIRNETGHQRGDQQPVHPVLLHDAVDDHDERAGWPADLHPGAAQRGDDEARDHRRVETTVGGDTAGDGEGDGERERHDADDDAGGEVRDELLAVVGLECGDELRDEH